MKKDPGDFLEWLSTTVKKTRAMHQRDHRTIPMEDITADVPCSTCVSCCKSGMEIPLSINMDPAWLAFYDRADSGRLLAKKDDGKTCYYLDHQSRGCTIYDQRPIVCRAYDCRKHLASRVIESELTAMAEQWESRQWYTIPNRVILEAIHLAAKDAGDGNSITVTDQALARFPEYLAEAQKQIQEKGNAFEADGAHGGH